MFWFIPMMVVGYCLDSWDKWQKLNESFYDRLEYIYWDLESKSR